MKKNNFFTFVFFSVVLSIVFFASAAFANADGVAWQPIEVGQEFYMGFLASHDGIKSVGNWYINGSGDCSLRIKLTLDNESIAFYEFENVSTLGTITVPIDRKDTKGKYLNFSVAEISPKRFELVDGLYHKIPQNTSCFIGFPPELITINLDTDYLMTKGNMYWLFHEESFLMDLGRKIFGSLANFYNSISFYLLWLLIILTGLFFLKSKNSAEMLLIYFLAVIGIAIFPFGNYSRAILGLRVLSYSAAALAIYLIWKNKSSIKEKIIMQEKSEKEAEKIREKDFSKNLSKLSNIKFLSPLVKCVYKEGWQYVLVLLLILFLFTAARAPYFNLSFTGEHTMKYNTHVEPAKYMHELNNPFWNQRKYLSDPVNNPQGILTTFSSPPIHEWGILSLMYIFPNNPIELNTRLWTNFLGIIMLTLAYSFFRKWFSKKLSLLITFLISINPIINLIFYVTVEDSILLIFTFASLIYLTDYIQKNRISDLFWAGLLFGIGNISKYSVFLWLAPIAFVLLAFNSKTLAKFLKSFGIYILLSLLPILAFRYSLRNLPRAPLISIVYFVIWIIIFVLIYFCLKKFEAQIDSFANLLSRNKPYLFGAVILSIIFGTIFLYFTGLYRFSSEFLTDSTLIFNWSMYRNMLTQFKSYASFPVYYIGLFAILSVALIKSKKQLLILSSFLLGSIFYWVMASKAMFFHSYYTGIIMVFFALSTGLLLYLISFINNKHFSFVILFICMLFVIPSSISENINILSSEADVDSLKEVADFLIENTEEHEIYIDLESNLYLTFLTNRPQTKAHRLHNSEILQLVDEIGIKETIQYYNISYIITTINPFQYERFLFLLTDEHIVDFTTTRRGSLINLAFSDHYVSNIGLIIEQSGIKNMIILKEQFGPYYIYDFSD